MKTQYTIEQITQAGHDEDDAPMILALCEHLECEPSDLEREKYDHWGLAIFGYGSRQYAIGTDNEVDQACHEEIANCVWAFNASFLASFTQLPEEVFTALQPRCEGANDAITQLIERTDGGMREFVEEAVSADGRGHFLSQYDGEENEVGNFYIYRVN